MLEILFFVSLIARADGDICTIRPDLCDVPTARAKPSAKPRARAPASTVARCFPPHAARQLNRNNLPICGAKAPLPQAKVAPVGTNRAPASATSLPITFESYMQSNATNPAMLRHGIEQQAFHETTKPAVLILPNIDGSPLEPASQTSSAGSSAAGLPGAPTPAPGTPAVGGAPAVSAPAGGGSSGSSDYTPGAGAK